MPTLDKIATPAELDTFVGLAKPGQRIIYHVGHLFLERDNDIEVKAVADRALRLAEDGYVHLFQQRLGDDFYRYIAEKRAR